MAGINEAHGARPQADQPLQRLGRARVESRRAPGNGSALRASAVDPKASSGSRKRAGPTPLTRLRASQ
jgi:hypothetical protein